MSSVSHSHSPETDYLFSDYRQCSLGGAYVGLSKKGLRFVFFGEDEGLLRIECRRRFPRAIIVDQNHGDFRGIEFIVQALDGCIQTSDQLQLDVKGTDFQLKVWRELQKIRPGQVSSYKNIAIRIGAPNSFRAVANACAANPIAVIIPCHRIICTNGILSNYRWGIDRKKQLLKRESFGLI